MDTNLALNGQQNQPEKFDKVMKVKVKRRIRMELDLSGAPQRPVAIETGTDEGAFSRMINDRYEDAFPVHKVPALVRELGPGFMEWLALQCGGTYHHDETPHLMHTAPLALVGLLANTAGRTIQHLLTDIQDHKDWNHQDLPNLRKLEAIIDTLIHDAEGVKHA